MLIRLLGMFVESLLTKSSLVDEMLSLGYVRRAYKIGNNVPWFP